MVSVNMVGVWECPACDYDRPMDDGKDAEKIISHLAGHLADRERVIVAQHDEGGQLLGVFEDYDHLDTWVEQSKWEKHDVYRSDAVVKTSGQ